MRRVVDCRLEAELPKEYKLVLSRNGQTWVSVGRDHKLRIWSAGKREPERVLGLGDDEQAVGRIQLSPDGALLFLQPSRGLDDLPGEIWDVDTGRSLVALKEENGRIQTAELSPDQMILATGNHRGQVRIWSPKNGALLALLPAQSDAVSALAFSPDGVLLASGSWDKTVQVWDLTQVRKALIAQSVPATRDEKE